MKKKIIIISVTGLVCAAAISLGVYLDGVNELKKLKNKQLDLPDGFTYTAHTGCVNTEDNSLEAIEAGVKHGAQIVEFDVNFTEDGTPVLSHDTPQGGEVTLDEAFGKVASYENLMVNVDLKSSDNLPAVVASAEKYGIKDRIFFTGVELSAVEAVKSACPGIDYYLNFNVEKESKQTAEYLDGLVEGVKGCGAVGINFNKDNATKELVDKFHENGLLVSIWTVNNEKEMYEILHLSPDNITTRNPDKMKEILEN